MHNWNSIFKRSEKINRILQAKIDEEANGPDSRDELDELSRGVAERLSDPVYLFAKGREQSRFDAGKAYAALHRRVHRRRMIRWAGVAASIILFVGVYLFWNLLQDEGMPMERVAIMPGEKKALLYMADGREIVLDDTLRSEIETFEGVLTIDSGEISCDVTPVASVPAKLEYHRMIVPRGGEYNLQLADGSKVWLNSETELYFPVQFGGDKREVYLKGEAYFEVEKGEKPFIVNTDLGGIRVLGTAFNIQTYDTNHIATTLVHGKVSYVLDGGTETILNPGEQLTYVRGDRAPVVETVNVKLYTAWKDHLFCFEEQSLESIMQTLARWYGVEVVFVSEDLKRLELSGTLDKYSKIEPLLKVFELGTSVKFEIRENRILVKKAK